MQKKGNGAEGRERRQPTRHRGVTRTKRADGKVVYEINFQGPRGDGSYGTVWETLPDGAKLSDAIARRGEYIGKVESGEKLPVRQRRKLRLSELADQWEEQARLRASTLKLYRGHLDRHVLPVLGHRPAQSLDVEDVLSLIHELERKGLSAHTVKGALSPLSKVMDFAERRKIIARNPLRLLHEGDRPSAPHSEMRSLGSDDEIERFLNAAATVSPETYAMLATAIFAGLRQSEELGLRWQDINFTDEVIHVRGQLGRDGVWRPVPKTERGFREIVMDEGLGRILREHKARSRYSGPTDYVFGTSIGTPLHYRNATRRSLTPTLERAKLIGDGQQRFRWHDMRHTAITLWIDEGHDKGWVSEQAGVSIRVMEDTYQHLFNRQAKSVRARAVRHERLGKIMERTGRKTAQQTGGEVEGEVLDLQAFRK